MTMIKKVLITGATGYLGQSLVPQVLQQADVVAVARNVESVSDAASALSIDLTNGAAVLSAIVEQQPDAIIHCAACNPGGSAQDMVAVNEIATKHVAQAAKELGCRLVSVSSDTVFDGAHAPYADDAQASPLSKNAYAVTKAKGEQHIRTLVPGAAIVRTSLIYGTDSIDRGTDGFKNRLAAGDTLKLFTDVIRQPVHDKALSAGLCALALDHVDESGFINLVGDEAMSRYDFGVRMLNFWGIEYAGQLEAISGEGIAGLPMNVCVNMERAKALGLATPGVTEVLG